MGNTQEIGQTLYYSPIITDVTKPSWSTARPKNHSTLHAPKHLRLGERPGFVEQHLPTDVINFLRKYGQSQDEAENVAIMLKNLRLDDPNRNIQLTFRQFPWKLLSISYARLRESVQVTHTWQVKNNRLRYEITTLPVI